MNVIEINTVDAPAAAPYARLTEAQLRRAGEGRGLFIAESMNVIKSALEAGHTPVSLLTERRRLEEISSELGPLIGETPVLTADEEELAKLTGYRLSRGFLCAMERKPLLPVEEALKGASRVAVLEGINDPSNVGAIIRSAAALGMDAVLLAENCCDPLHRRAARVSMGAVFRIPWAALPCKAGNANAVDMSALRENGFFAAAAALTAGSLAIDDPSILGAEKLAVLLGSEGNGLCPETVACADSTVMIPMARGVDSLNVAAAAAVIFWTVAKK